MINGQKIIVVMPAYNAEQTLEKTYSEIPFGIVDDVILTDDCSRDGTVEAARRLGIGHILIHERNRGYGGNQKTCYDKALELGADIVVMLHPDYQYTPKLIEPMCCVIANGLYPVMLGSRILGKGARKGGMPCVKYVANRGLTLFQNIMLGQKLSEYHTGFRAFSADVLRAVDYHACSDDFVFDNQILAQIFWHGFEICEITCPTKYFDDASSIDLRRSTVYAFGVSSTSFVYRLSKWKIMKSRLWKGS
ncbi:MAG: glycosyltransferase family 2 protein [Rikenellaceae bacterium]|nr:glycosyltransferase family 2 protein [Rikenellaceae bacterium]